MIVTLLHTSQPVLKKLDSIAGLYVLASLLSEQDTALLPRKRFRFLLSYLKAIFENFDLLQK